MVRTQAKKRMRPVQAGKAGRFLIGRIRLNCQISLIRVLGEPVFLFNKRTQSV